MKKTQKKLMQKRFCLIFRTLACISFLILVIIGVSSLVHAMSLEPIDNDDGVPTAWREAANGKPDSITLPITYWDQKADACDNENRQFEWASCYGYHTHGVLTGMVKSRLGSDRLPIPAFTNQEASWQALHDALSINVIGNDPVQKTDNFYRWFHEVPGISKRINGRTVTFNRTTEETYVYGGQDIYPIDDVPGLDADDIQLKDTYGQEHNFNFTAHLGFAIKVRSTGEELFQFSGDDDVWVFLNNRLVLDIGGLHGPISGWFRINSDGTVSTYIEKVNDLSIRSGDWVECMRMNGSTYATSECMNTFNAKIRDNFKNVTVSNADFGLKAGDVVNLDFFYAERSTDGSNTKITISHMDWPISADSDITANIIGKIDGTERKLVEFNTNVKNRDPENPLTLERLAAYIREENGDITNEGYLPLDKTTLWYTTTPEDEKSWRPVDISAPDNSEQGFNLATPIQMAPSGQPGDTLYFRYYGETLERPAGTMSSTISYYTTLAGNAGVTYDYDEVEYNETTIPPVDPDPNPDPGTPEEPDPTPDPDPDPENPGPTPPVEELPNIPTIPGTNIIDGNDDLSYLPPLGEISFVPNTGTIGSASKDIFGEDFAEVITSQWVILATLLVFAGSFSVYFSMRKSLTFNPAMRSTSTKAKALKATVKSTTKAAKDTRKKTTTRQAARANTEQKTKSAARQIVTTKSNPKSTKKKA